MSLLLAALALLLASGIAAAALRRRPGTSSAVAAIGTVAAAVLGLIPSVRVLVDGAAVQAHAAWQMPFGSLAVAVDPLTAWFLAPILLLSALSAVYGAGYFRAHDPHASTSMAWFWFQILVASMVMVCIARNAVLFLLAWETMALSSFFLVAHDKHKPEVRRAAWTYMVATYLGTACLLPMFLLLGRASGSLDFPGLSGAHLSPGMTTAVLVLALIGFGAKAGVMPAHVWLPEAHPVAPSHVSALMSGVMIKTGIYGLVRVAGLLNAPPVWWGVALVFLGIVSGVLGVLFALAQHDLKRLLAYHSVENIGIILLGLGVGWVGVSLNNPAVAALGFAGGLLHVLNHALFKGLLFLGAGSVLTATHTSEIDHLGGLLRKMPVTGVTFLIGAVAICGLPPLNGFVSEFVIYAGSFTGALTAQVWSGVVLAGVVAALALIGGLAVACFTKAFGVVFLGEPRASHAAPVRESGRLMTVPMAVLAVCCTAVGLAGPAALVAVTRPVALLTGRLDMHGVFAHAVAPLVKVSALSLTLVVVVALVAVVRWRLLAGRAPAAGPTWDCGFSRPTARMQYTASSFAQPITDLFAKILHTRKVLVAPPGYFPSGGRIETETPDFGRERIFDPLFSAASRALHPLLRIQQGHAQMYILYVIIALVVMLVWKVR